MGKLLVVCGLTATGKTTLGVRLAKKFNGEIVSADSRQVYKGMDIMTGKDLPENSKFKIQNSKLNIEDINFSVGYREKDGIPIWLVDIVDPDYTFNVAEYKKLADKVIENIRVRRLLPIAVGGTGLYIKALTTSLDLIYIPINQSLRKKISILKREELASKLMKINPEKWNSMNESDRKNPRRLIRAIEISQAMKKENINSVHLENRTRDDILLIGLTVSSFKELYKLIDRRVEERAKNGEAEKEVFRLLQKGYSFDLPSFSVCGFKPILQSVEKVISLKKALTIWKFMEHDYARRQLIWFKRDARIHWFDITEKDYLLRIEERVGKWYTEINC